MSWIYSVNNTLQTGSRSRNSSVCPCPKLARPKTRSRSTSHNSARSGSISKIPTQGTPLRTPLQFLFSWPGCQTKLGARNREKPRRKWGYTSCSLKTHPAEGYHSLNLLWWPCLLDARMQGGKGKFYAYDLRLPKLARAFDAYLVGTSIRRLLNWHKHLMLT